MQIPYKYSIFPDQPQYPKIKLEIQLWTLPYTIKIIDLSYHQRPELIDYDKLAEQADGFILRAAYGTGVDGKWEGQDPALNTHYDELCVKRGKPCGVYHYIVAYKRISDQVTVMKNAVEGKKLHLGMWCDAELEKNAEPLKAEHIISYMTEAEARIGKFEGIYNGHWCWMDIMGEHEADYSHKKLWMSAYTASPDNYIPHGWDKWWLWQYTSSARLPGYNRNLDVSYFYGDRQAFNNWIGDKMLLEIEPLSQVDPQWKSIQLGTSNKTIGSHGCVITSATMMLRHFGINMNPAELNTWLKANGGYHNQNLFVWGVLSKLSPNISFGYRYGYAALDKIDEKLNQGRPVFINVDYYPNTPAIDEHWSLVVGKENGSYIINDPKDGRQLKFEDRYGDPRKKIYNVCTYNFTGVIQPPIEDPVEEANVLYRVRVKITNLVIRNAPDKNATVVQKYAHGEYDVFEEKNGYGRIGTNRWISIDPEYVEKIDNRLDILWKAHPSLHGDV